MSFFHFDRITQFAESDAAGIIHFSNIARYVEEAEHAFLASAGFPLNLHDPDSCRWPRVQYTAAYTQPLLPMQKIRVKLHPLYVGKSSINWSWAICYAGREDVMCNGEMKVVCCKGRNGRIEACMLPEKLRKRLSAS